MCTISRRGETSVCNAATKTAHKTSSNATLLHICRVVTACNQNTERTSKAVAVITVHCT